MQRSAPRRKDGVRHAESGLTDKLSGYIVPFHAPEGYAPSFTVAVDIATEGLLTPGYTGSVDLCIDHHPTNTHYAAGTLLCDDRSSCGEIVLEVIKGAARQHHQARSDAFIHGAFHGQRLL